MENNQYSRLESAPKTIGTPIEDLVHSVGPQIRTDSCALHAQKHVLDMFGVDIPEEDIIADAIEHGEYKDDGQSGTSIDYIGNVLERNGIPVHRYVDATFGHMIAELAQGHKVIVAVDANEYVATTPEEQRYQQYLDSIREVPNHAVVVSNIDPRTFDVDIVDPADGCLHRIPGRIFADAYRDSHGFMIATSQSPAEWRAEHGCPTTGMGSKIDLSQLGDDSMMQFIDTNGDGLYEIIGIDYDHDGVIDHYFSDRDHDGIPDEGVGSFGSVDSLVKNIYSDNGGNDGMVNAINDVSGSQYGDPDVSLGSLGHCAGITGDGLEVSLGSLGHCAGVQGHDLDVNLGSLGHCAGIPGDGLEVSLGSLGHCAGVQGHDLDVSLGSLGHCAGVSVDDGIDVSLGSLGHCAGIPDDDIDAGLGGLGHCS